ncbi:MAG: cytochrome c biogenesis CcdA family protein [Leptospirales bacterium]
MTHLFAFAAGTLSTLSPCVLPLIPVVLAGASKHNRFGPLALMAGLVLSFTLAGIFIAQFGFSLGMNQQTIRTFAAVILLVAGLFLLLTSLQQRFIMMIDPLLNGLRNYIDRFQGSGLGGQLTLGLLLGFVWAPCVGPTLGAASGLAMQTETLIGATLVMVVFAIGAGTPLVIIAYAGERFMTKRKKMSKFARYGKPILGVLLAYTGLSIITGLDKYVEMHITEAMPQWLIDITTRF